MHRVVDLLHEMFPAQPKAPASCLCCGQCCEQFGRHLRASRQDVERWQALGRTDLLERVNRLGWIWVDPETKEHYEDCPYLERIDEQTAVCGIQEIKPDMCRAYPTLAHGKRCLRGVFLSLELMVLESAGSGVVETLLETASIV